MATGSKNICAVILAGGEARRMEGQDKGLITLGNKTLTEYVIDRIAPQVDTIVINANRNQDDYRHFGYPVISDHNEHYLGPLAGIARALEHIEKNRQNEYVLVVPCDCPFLPQTLVKTMWRTLQQENKWLCVARDNERLQPLISLWRLTPSLKLHQNLYNSIAAGHLKVERWMLEQQPAVAGFNDQHAFMNINCQADLDIATQLLDQFLGQ